MAFYGFLAVASRPFFEALNQILELAEKRGQKKVLPVPKIRPQNATKAVRLKVAKNGPKLRKNDAKKTQPPAHTRARRARVNQLKMAD